MSDIKGREALGLLEVDGVCAAFAAVDAAAKAGNIRIESMERTRQGCNVCIKMRGDVSSVQAAMEAAIEVAGQVASVGKHSVIPAPTSDTEKMLIYSDV